MINLNEFKKLNTSLIVYNKGQEIFSSNKSEIKPLVDFIEQDTKTKSTEMIIFDKKVGRASALLLSIIKPAKVFTPIATKKAVEILLQSNIPLIAEKVVENLMGVANEETCKWEKLSIDKSSNEFLQACKINLNRLK